MWETPAEWGVYPLGVKMPVSASACALPSEKASARVLPHTLIPSLDTTLPSRPARVMQNPASGIPASVLASLPRLRQLPLEEVHALADEVAQCERFSREQHSFFSANDTKLNLVAEVLMQLNVILMQHCLPQSESLVKFTNLARMIETKFGATRRDDLGELERLKCFTGIDLNAEPWTIRPTPGKRLRLVFTDFEPLKVLGDLNAIVEHLGMRQSGIVNEADIRRHAKRVVATTRRFLMMVDACMRSMAETALRESAELVGQLLTQRELTD